MLLCFSPVLAYLAFSFPCAFWVFTTQVTICFLASKVLTGLLLSLSLKQQQQNSSSLFGCDLKSERTYQWGRLFSLAVLSLLQSLDLGVPWSCSPQKTFLSASTPFVILRTDNSQILILHLFKSYFPSYILVPLKPWCSTRSYFCLPEVTLETFLADSDRRVLLVSGG